ncbi:Stargazin related stg-1-like protein, partial [Daphnia magna]
KADIKNSIVTYIEVSEFIRGLNPLFYHCFFLNLYFAELHKSLVAEEKIHELLRFTISTNLKKDVEQPYTSIFDAVYI